MWYAIIGTDVPDSLEKRMQARPAHLERLHALKNTGSDCYWPAHFPILITKIRVLPVLAAA
jgi:uncharacterized protein YciI